MPPLDVSQFALACRLFLESAYPKGAESIPLPKRPYFRISPDAAVEDYLNPAPVAAGICQRLGDTGYAFRLGCAGYASLKLKAQHVDLGEDAAWVYAVDTHDAFTSTRAQPPADHPDAPAWFALQAANRILKQKIESAWEAAGVLTLNRLLRRQLDEVALVSPGF